MGRVVASSADPNFVKADAIPWLKVEAAGAQAGPTGGESISGTTFIQRLNTEGSLAPSTGCARPTDIGNKAFMPDKADYLFYSPYPSLVSGPTDRAEARAMKITILDDYFDTVRTLPSFAKLNGHGIQIFTHHIQDTDELADRLKDTEALVLIRRAD